MKFVLTYSEILDKGNWDKFCELKGLNPYCMNEGLADSNEEVELTIEQIKQYDLSDLLETYSKLLE